MKNYFKSPFNIARQRQRLVKFFVICFHLGNQLPPAKIEIPYLKSPIWLIIIVSLTNLNKFVLAIYIIIKTSTSK